MLFRSSHDPGLWHGYPLYLYRCAGHIAPSLPIVPRSLYHVTLILDSPRLRFAVQRTPFGCSIVTLDFGNLLEDVDTFPQVRAHHSVDLLIAGSSCADGSLTRAVLDADRLYSGWTAARSCW